MTKLELIEWLEGEILSYEARVLKLVDLKWYQIEKRLEREKWNARLESFRRVLTIIKRSDKL